MALPKLNAPTHELVLPSTGEKIKFRPFLVKEQKMLLLAQESKNEQQLIDTVVQLISNCTFEKVNAETAPMFDVEYIFLKLRSKSVGETAELNLLCNDDGKTRVPVKINLDKIDVHMTVDHTNEIQLSEDPKVKVVLSYPRLRDTRGVPDGINDYQKMFMFLNKCIYEIHHNDKIYNTVDTNQKDVDDFIDSMSSEQLNKILEFFTSMPKLRHTVKYVNPNTKVTNEVTLEGLSTFLE